MTRNQMTSKETSTGNDKKIVVLQNQIIYLKNQLINIVLENVFKSAYPK